MSDLPSQEATLQDQRNRRFLLAASAAGPLRSDQVISSHALLLEVDLRLAFCAGAWSSVIVLACVAVEAQHRQVSSNDYISPARDLFSGRPELQWLRSLRNELVHAGEPGIKSRLWRVGRGDIGENQRALEGDAIRAVEAMFKEIYGCPERKRSET